VRRYVFVYFLFSRTTTIRKKINETKTNSCAIEQEKKSIDSRKSKQQQRTPSPVLKTISDIPEEDHVKTRDSSTSSSSSSSSSTSTSTNTEQRKMKKNKRKKSKHRSSTNSYDISKEYPASKRSVLPPKTKITDKKSTAKSKLVLENVRKMMKDQNIQDQHFNKTQQKESARL